MVYSLGAELSVMGVIESDQNVGGGNCQARLSDQTDGILAFTSLRLIFEGQMQDSGERPMRACKDKGFGQDGLGRSTFSS